MGYMHIDNLRLWLRQILNKLFLNKILKKVKSAENKNLEYITLTNKQINKLRNINTFLDAQQFQGVNKYYVLKGEVGKIYGKRILKNGK